MRRRDLTFRVFVSSTFGDLVAERNALQEAVFPRLRRFCQRHGGRFQAIDLRWGVPEEAGRDQQTMNICLEEIRRCQRVSPRPNFVFLLGERYGWCPLPPQIDAAELEPLLAQVSDRAQAHLRQWYWRDDNAAPPEYLLQPRKGRFEDRTVWGAEEAELLASLREAVERAGWAAEDLRRLKYEAAATHQEMLLGAMQSEDPRSHVFGFFRTIVGLPRDATAGVYLDLDQQGQPDRGAAARLAQLKADMRTRLPGNVHDYSATWIGSGPGTEHLRRLCVDVYRGLRRVICQEIDRIDRADPLDLEIEAHAAFGLERASHFLGREDVLASIRAYLGGGNRKPLVVYGVSGVGKSALMARVAHQPLPSASVPGEVVARYIGATPGSSDLRGLLEGLCKEITRRYGGDPASVPMDLRELEQDFPRRLALATADRPLAVFIDALDQLGQTDGAQGLAWLPRELPQHAKLVVAVLEGESIKVASQGPEIGASHLAMTAFEAARRRVHEGNLVPIPPLTIEQGGRLLDAWLASAGRNLQPAQRKEILAKFRNNGLPLYLKVAFQEARRWPWWHAARQSTVALAPDVPGLLRDLLIRLEQPQHHGEVLVGRALGYLAAARHGLTEDELLDLLSADEEVMADFIRRSRTETKKSPDKRLKRLPVVIWSRLYADIEPYMTPRRADGTVVLGFYHRQVGEAVRSRYLAGEDVRFRVHRDLAAYFQGQAYFAGERGHVRPGPGRVRSVNVRKVVELPHHRLEAAKLRGGSDPASPLWDEVADLLSDWQFLEAKNEAPRE